MKTKLNKVQCSGLLFCLKLSLLTILPIQALATDYNALLNWTYPPAERFVEGDLRTVFVDGYFLVAWKERAANGSLAIRVESVDSATLSLTASVSTADHGVFVSEGENSFVLNAVSNGTVSLFIREPGRRSVSRLQFQADNGEILFLEKDVLATSVDATISGLASSALSATSDLMVLAWVETDDSQDSSVVVLPVDATGVPASPTKIDSPQVLSRPTVAVGTSTFLVAWDSLESTGREDVQFVRFDTSTYLPIDPQGVKVTNEGTNSGSRPSVVFDGARYTLVWETLKFQQRLAGGIGVAAIEETGAFFLEMETPSWSNELRNPSIVHGEGLTAVTVYDQYLVTPYTLGLTGGLLDGRDCAFADYDWPYYLSYDSAIGDGTLLFAQLVELNNSAQVRLYGLDATAYGTCSLVSSVILKEYPKQKRNIKSFDNRILVWEEWLGPYLNIGGAWFSNGSTVAWPANSWDDNSLVEPIGPVRNPVIVENGYPNHLLLWEEWSPDTGWDIFGSFINPFTGTVPGSRFTVANSEMDEILPAVGEDVGGGDFPVAWYSWDKRSNQGEVRYARIGRYSGIVGPSTLAGIVIGDERPDIIVKSLVNIYDSFVVLWLDGFLKGVSVFENGDSAHFEEERVKGNNLSVFTAYDVASLIVAATRDASIELFRFDEFDLAVGELLVRDHQHVGVGTRPQGKVSFSYQMDAMLLAWVGEDGTKIFGEVVDNYDLVSLRTFLEEPLSLQSIAAPTVAMFGEYWTNSFMVAWDDFWQPTGNREIVYRMVDGHRPVFYDCIWSPAPYCGNHAEYLWSRFRNVELAIAAHVSGVRQSGVATDSSLQKRRAHIAAIADLREKQDEYVDGLIAVSGSGASLTVAALSTFLRETEFNGYFSFHPVDECSSMTVGDSMLGYVEAIIHNRRLEAVQALSNFVRVGSCYNMAQLRALDWQLAHAYYATIDRFPQAKKQEVKTALLSTLANLFLIILDEVRPLGPTALFDLVSENTQELKEAYSYPGSAASLLGLWLKDKSRDRVVQIANLCERQVSSPCVSASHLIEAIVDPVRLGLGLCNAVEMISMGSVVGRGYFCPTNACLGWTKPDGDIIMPPELEDVSELLIRETTPFGLAISQLYSTYCVGREDDPNGEPSGGGFLPLDRYLPDSSLSCATEQLRAESKRTLLGCITDNLLNQRDRVIVGVPSDGIVTTKPGCFDPRMDGGGEGDGGDGDGGEEPEDTSGICGTASNMGNCVNEQMEDYNKKFNEEEHSSNHRKGLEKAPPEGAEAGMKSMNGGQKDNAHKAGRDSVAGARSNVKPATAEEIKEAGCEGKVACTRRVKSEEGGKTTWTDEVLVLDTFLKKATKEEFAAVMDHELGHAYQLGYLDKMHQGGFIDTAKMGEIEHQLHWSHCVAVNDCSEFYGELFGEFDKKYPPGNYGGSKEKRCTLDEPCGFGGCDSGFVDKVFKDCEILPSPTLVDPLGPYIIPLDPDGGPSAPGLEQCFGDFTGRYDFPSLCTTVLCAPDSPCNCNLSSPAYSYWDFLGPDCSVILCDANQTSSSIGSGDCGCGLGASLDFNPPPTPNTFVPPKLYGAGVP